MTKILENSLLNQFKRFQQDESWSKREAIFQMNLIKDTHHFVIGWKDGVGLLANEVKTCQRGGSHWNHKEDRCEQHSRGTFHQYFLWEKNSKWRNNDIRIITKCQNETTISYYVWNISERLPRSSSHSCMMIRWRSERMSLYWGYIQRLSHSIHDKTYKCGVSPHKRWRSSNYWTTELLKILFFKDEF